MKEWRWWAENVLSRPLKGSAEGSGWNKSWNFKLSEAPCVTVLFFQWYRILHQTTMRFPMENHLLTRWFVWKFGISGGGAWVWVVKDGQSKQRWWKIEGWKTDQRGSMFVFIWSHGNDRLAQCKHQFCILWHKSVKVLQAHWNSQHCCNHLQYSLFWILFEVFAC